MRWFLIFLIAASANATVYYCDFATGSDANNGTSTSTPWKHLPGDASATGTPAGLTVNGDTFYLKGGVTYNITTTHGIVVSSANYTTAAGASFLSGEAVGWGSGRPVIDGNGTGYFWFQSAGMTGVTFRGLEMQQCIGVTNNAGLFIFNCTSNFIDGCYIHDAATNSSSAHRNCIEFSGGGNHNTLTNCYVWNATQKDIETHDTTIQNLIINNHLGAAADHCVTISSDLNVIRGNIISNAAVANVGSYLKTDPGYGLKFSSSSLTTCRSNIAYNNFVIHCNSGLVFDNVGNQDMTYNRAFNNTFIDMGYGQSSPMGMMTYSVGSSGLHNNSEVRNNIFWINQIVNPGTFLTAIRVVGSSLGANNTISHNCWGTTNGTLFCMITSGGTQQPTFANFADSGSTSPDYRFSRAAFGSGNSFTDTANQFFNTDPGFTALATPTLQATSPVLAAGMHLTSYFTTDILGLVRANWSMGAYEYGGTPAPNPIAVVFPGTVKIVGAVRSQ